ncbi:hypothetical protein N7468_006738 [Penicillium chermesinum]|uniref:O-methyltransferase domain-containing protein n=1 Tax=Penicillium chermesinum TaxID=63820 RepID=A0A9W9TJZ2_9EURO|nr:uncharacterized protein N7468_006738 [Penicillium chermesinum]KAJ5225513.1 hypothetical protein N7468_006738 [Penicillium chermesinum]
MNISQLVQSIDTLATAGQLNSIDENQRVQLYQACSKLRAAPASPLDRTLELLFSGHQAMAVRLGVDLKLFDSIARHSAGDSEKFITVSQISGDIKADAKLVRRIMRFLASMGILKQISRDEFQSTSFAGAYVSASPLSAAVVYFTHFHSIISRLPQYFEDKGWNNPEDIDDSPFQAAMGIKSRYFDYLKTKPYYQDAFNKFMASSYGREGKKWFECFPVAGLLCAECPSDVLLVDIGGCHGVELEAFHKKFPDAPGRLILQDLLHVIETGDLPAGVEAQGYNFFDEQPVKGARAYYLRNVLHDWPDELVLKILGRIREAMAAESLLLIEERVLPEANIPLLSALGDMSMMVLFAAAERTKGDTRAS